MSIPIVKIILVIFYPLAKPISMVLDYFLGKEVATYYSKEEVRGVLGETVFPLLLCPCDPYVSKRWCSPVRAAVPLLCDCVWIWQRAHACVRACKRALCGC